MGNSSGGDVSRWIQDVRQTQPDRLDALLETYRNYLRLLARVWIDASLRVKADPSDLVQETLIKAHQGFSQFRGMTEPELTGWLRQILARAVIDLVRRYKVSGRRIDREQSIDELLDTSAQSLHKVVASDESSPSGIAERRELGVVLADALAELREDYREVIVLRNLEEMDWPAIGQRLGRSPAAARMLWTRALMELRPRIERRL